MTRKVLLTLQGHRDSIWSVAWSPDGRRLATASQDNTVKVWNAGSGKELLTLSSQGADVGTMAWSADGKRLATGSGFIRLFTASQDQAARVWNAESGKVLLTLNGHTTVVSTLAWSPDGKRLATGGLDNTVKVWDTARGRELLTFDGYVASVKTIAWSPDGKRLATGSDDGVIEVYAMDIPDLMALAGGRVTAQPSQKGCKKYLHVDKCPPVPQLSW